MFFRVDWVEEGAGPSHRIYRAADFRTLWRVVKHMNIERRIARRPLMRQIKIKELEKYEGEFFDITDNFDANMAIDTDRSEG